MTLNNALLQQIVNQAECNHEGKTANYIPELANVAQSITAIAVQAIGEAGIYYSNVPLQPVTLQSTSKLILLIGLLEEFGLEKLRTWVKVEPSGDDFASITRLAQFGPMPSNPMLNAGAITLCSHIPGDAIQKLYWIDHWTQRLFNKNLHINNVVLESEKRTGDRNRSLAYLLRSKHSLGAPVEETLDVYFSLCSYEANIMNMLYLPALLANQGKDPITHERIISIETCKITLSIMATCGLYDETGTHMVKTGMPAKSGVSGYILAAVPGKAGVVTFSPLVNKKGNSIRGEIMLQLLSEQMHWHFAIP